MGTLHVVYLDFALTFDLVNHRFLLAKLKSFSLSKTVVRWIRYYLTGRAYRVEVGVAFSQETRITIGVP